MKKMTENAGCIGDSKTSAADSHGIDTVRVQVAFALRPLLAVHGLRVTWAPARRRREAPKSNGLWLHRDSIRSIQRSSGDAVEKSTFSSANPPGAGLLPQPSRRGRGGRYLFTGL